MLKDEKMQGTFRFANTAALRKSHVNTVGHPYLASFSKIAGAAMIM